MTAFRTFALALTVGTFAASVAVAAPPTHPTTQSGLGTATSAPGATKRSDTATSHLSSPGKATPPSGVTPGFGKTGTAPAK